MHNPPGAPQGGDSDHLLILDVELLGLPLQLLIFRGFHPCRPGRTVVDAHLRIPNSWKYGAWRCQVGRA